MNSDELIEKLKAAQERYGVLPVVSVNAGGSGDIDQVIVVPILLAEEPDRIEIQLVEGL